MSKVKVVMENGGEFVIELYPEYAPVTVKNFEKLVKKADELMYLDKISKKSLPNR